MRNYLSFGGGVNSVAMMLLLLDEGVEFEAVYVDHECDWPETNEYIRMLQEKYPITIIQPEYKKRGITFNNLYDYCLAAKIIPLRQIRWCTAKFKVNPLHRYFKKPCFVMLGIDAGEAHRAKLSSDKGMENRFPLIERDINRQDCIEIIKSHGLPIPMKSGCWFCPFQRIGELKKLRHIHPELFCKAVELEKISLDYALRKGRSIANSTLIKPKTLTEWINERDTYLFDDMAYPPCQCGL
jgi:hypothetical protein